MESIADRLIIAAKQLEHLASEVRRAEPTPDDLVPLAAFLYTLGETGRELGTLALDAVDRADPGHPVRSVKDGAAVQVYLAHAGNLLEAVQTFAGDARELLEKMPRA